VPEPDQPRDLYESERADRSNARLGLLMFFIYCAVYAGFVGLCAFSLKTMERPILGVNLAVFYGFGLIGFAFVLALIYTFLCKSDDTKA
jgi:uncharacterized membrane protein (DUF485 family)